MTLTPDRLHALLTMLAHTRSHEVTCDDCFQELAEFAEHRLSGKSVPEGLRAIEQHLTQCGECREEFETLRQALTAT